MDYTIPLGLVASIVPLDSEEDDGTRAMVTLRSGEELRFERGGDLDGRNGGLLIFSDGRERAEYVPWADVERIDLDPPPSNR